MNTGVIASRYATTLLRYATSCMTECDLYDMMKRISACFAEIPDLEKTFSNRMLSAEERKALFLDLFPGAPEKPLKVLSDFLDLLIRQRRENIIRSVSLLYLDKYRLQEGITYGVLTTVAPIDNLTAEKLKSSLDPVNPQKVELELKQDPGLIGGFSLRVGMKVWDASLLARLREVRKAYGLKDIY